MLFDGGFTFGNFIADAFTIFMFILWFWLLIVVSGDLFRRHDVSGFAKVLWVIAFVLFSYLGVFAYLLTQGRGMAERNRAQASEAREELRHIVGFSAADEIVKLDKLKTAGSITGAGIRPPESQAGPITVRRERCSADSIMSNERPHSRRLARSPDVREARDVHQLRK